MRVGLFGRKSRREDSSGTHDRSSDKTDRAHLEEFVKTRPGVEAFVEPRTAVTETTIMLVARTGEWTRRRVPDPATAHTWANKLGVPSYDAGLVGYPQRKRDWDARKAIERKRLLSERDEEK
jgi:hypothetical protein